MRLFTAVSFDESLKNKIAMEAEKFQQITKSGSFSSPRNFHLTLKFLGEVETSRVKSIREALLNALEDQFCFTIRTGGFGSFKSRSGQETLWIGVQRSDKLSALYDRLETELYNAGFPRDARKFHPHITIARMAVCDGEATEKIKIEPLPVPVTTVTLFESIRRGGELRYEPLFEAPLNLLKF